jgi:hypothetical protein
LQIAYDLQLFDQTSLDRLSLELSKVSEAPHHTNFPTETAEDVIQRHFLAANTRCDPVQPVEILLVVAREPRVDDHRRKLLEYGTLRALPERIPEFSEAEEVVHLEYEDEEQGNDSDLAHENLFEDDQEQFGEIPLYLGPDIGFPNLGDMEQAPPDGASDDFRVDQMFYLHTLIMDLVDDSMLGIRS